MFAEENGTPSTGALPGSEVASAYNQWSHTYESIVNPTRDMAAQILRRQLPDLQGRDILEIGCGTGVNTRYLAALGKSVVALDFSPGMLAQAQANVTSPNVRFAQQDIRLPWNVSDASIDLIVCTLVLEHVEALEPIFQEAARVLRPGGEFFFCELHPFRQILGGQAQFLHAETGETVLVSAYYHDVSDYINPALQQGFRLLHLGEWRDKAGEAKETSPRVLSVQLQAPAS